jgi:hypothetical protein
LSQLAILKKSLNLLVIVAMIFGMVVPAFAEESPITNQQEQEADYTELLKEAEAQKTRYEHAVQQMERHIFVGKDGLFHLEVESGTALGIDEEIYQELSTALAKTNELIASGRLTLEEIAFANGKNVFGEEVQRNGDGYTLACAGWTGQVYTWMGPRTYLNHCDTEIVIGLIQMAAGVAALCGLIAPMLGAAPVGAVCLLAAGLYAIGAGAIQAVNALGGHQGIYIQQFWIGDIAYFWHQ